jgi:hypothetical protein
LARCSPEQISASLVRLVGTKRARIVTRTRAEEYRRLAQQCLAMARSASTEEGRATLLEAAQSWFRLVEEQDHESANIESVPPNSVEERPVVQQQQQVQPKDESKD